MEKSANIRVIQLELNDFLGVCAKIKGPVESVRTAVERGRQLAEQMGGQPVSDVITQLAAAAERPTHLPLSPVFLAIVTLVVLGALLGVTYAFRNAGKRH